MQVLLKAKPKAFYLLLRQGLGHQLGLAQASGRLGRSAPHAQSVCFPHLTSLPGAAECVFECHVGVAEYPICSIPEEPWPWPYKGGDTTEQHGSPCSA